MAGTCGKKGLPPRQSAARHNQQKGVRIVVETFSLTWKTWAAVSCTVGQEE